MYKIKKMSLIRSFSNIQYSILNLRFHQYVGKKNQEVLKDVGSRSKNSPMLDKKVSKSISNPEIRRHKAPLVGRGISCAYDLCSGSSSTAAKKRLIMRLLLDSAETATSVCAESMNSFRRRRLLKPRPFKAAPRTCWQARL